MESSSSTKQQGKNILSLFQGHVKPGGVIKGATVPDLELLESLRQTLIRRGLLSYATIFEAAFQNSEPGSDIFHPFLEIIRTLALEAPVCHLVKPHIWFEITEVSNGKPVVQFLNTINKYSPMLSRLLRYAKGGPAQPEIQHLLRDMLVVSKRAFPDELEEEEEEESDDDSLHSDSDDSEDAENPSVEWSEDESFLRT